MSVFSYPILLIFLIGALLIFIASLFVKKMTIPFIVIGIFFVVLFTINAFLLSFPYIEIIIYLLIPVIVLFITIICRGKKQ